VRRIFNLYRELGCVRRVKEEADRLGLRTKCSTTADGIERGGKPFSRGHIYGLLANPIYTGQIYFCRTLRERRLPRFAHDHAQMHASLDRLAMLEAGGARIFFGPAPGSLLGRRKFLGEIDAKYKDARVKVWRQSRICGLLRQFPGVSLQIKNRAGLLSYDQWTTRLDMRQAFVAAYEPLIVMSS
jgi:hypothetical protein